ncbi:kinase-like domain-containing protein [Radiomyces spectabilis]|uniref:kinase-like domain-containing protein n=1 Tax=Radiomyces spectabilis TaxID=64574 RepID=UPI00221FE8CD|nr:kinase-like domain-containing protein [Radiomyces spectabilis]KAI8379689.1 kinase-like domain-containing protein [Radiomyces spectabilis]
MVSLASLSHSLSLHSTHREDRQRSPTGSARSSVAGSASTDRACGDRSSMAGLSNVAVADLPTPPSSVSASRPCLSKYRRDTGSVHEYGESFRRLIHGSTAEILVCHKQVSGCQKLYAIKQFRKRSAKESEKDYMKKLTSEFCISSTFSHPNIVETIDLVLNDQKRYCTVMEYCPGGDLFSCIMDGHMTEVERACSLKQILKGVAYLHSVGVAHRDIKPENILLTMDGKLKITDFGVADVYRCAWESVPHQSRGLVGSEPYIAPEAFEPDHVYWGAAADVWSVGVVAICLWTHSLAWHRAQRTVDRAFRTYLQHFQSRSFANFKNLPSHLRRLLYRMLDPNPQTRISSSDLLVDDWVKSIPVCVRCKDSQQQVHHHLSTRRL